MRSPREWSLALAVMLALLAVVALAGVARPPDVGSSGSPASGAAAGASASTAARSGPGAIDPASGLPTIARADLPREARTTLDLIAAGGPFLHSADGATFENRERLLPTRPRGTYREYTVETPGSADRGARRIVVAATGEWYWSADHYASFARIAP